MSNQETLEWLEFWSEIHITRTAHNCVMLCWSYLPGVPTVTVEILGNAARIEDLVSSGRKIYNPLLFNLAKREAEKNSLTNPDRGV